MKITKEQATKIAQRVHTDYLHDEADRAEWLEKTEKAIKIANQHVEEKTFPWRGASNIKLPMILDASIKFATRAYSEIIPNGQVVKCSITSPDKQARADRVTNYMSWQLLTDETNWEADTDKLLHMLPIVGHMFRKRFYCITKQRTDSELIMPNKIACSEDGRRKTHILKLTHSDILSRQRSGEWREIKLQEVEGLDEQPCYDVLESHCWLDLDNDGYEEPYIVVMEVDSMDVLDVVPRFEAKDVLMNAKNQIVRIEPTEYFIDYIFIPNFAGGYYGVGFGQLLMPLTLAANSLMNQLVDAGSLSNVQGGYLTDKVKILSGTANFEIGEWKKAAITGQGNLSDHIYPMPVREPSATLFSLLGLVIDMVNNLGSVKDILSGDVAASNMPATTTVALIEQGMKTFNAIYKRIYRSLKNEFKLLYKLNGQYLDETEYFNYNDEMNPILREDFDATGLDIIPQADPNMSSQMQRLGRAEALRQLIGAPGVDPRPIITTYLQALDVDAMLIEQILPPPQPPQPDPEMVKAQAEMQQQVQIKQSEIMVKEQELDIKRAELAMKMEAQDVKNTQVWTQAVQNLAVAESMETETQNQQHMADVNQQLAKEQINKPSQRPIIGE